MLTVYLAGPITGTSYSRATGWRESFGLMNQRLRTLSPMRGKGYLKDLATMPLQITSDSRRFLSSPRAIYTRDLYDVRRSDVVLANFLEAKEKSLGTTFEIGFARALGKIVVVVMEPDGNPHDHPFIREAANFIVHSIPDAERLLEQLA